MKQPLRIATIFACSVMWLACDPSPSGEAPAVTDGDDIEVVAGAEDVGPLSIPEISGLDYDEARELLLAGGWVPEMHDPGYGSSVEASSGNGPIFWSRGYRELESCSGTGAAACSFRFLGPNGEELVVVTEGEEDEDGAYHARVARSFLDPEEVTGSD